MKHLGLLWICLLSSGASSVAADALSITVDNAYSLYVDGVLVGEDNHWTTVETYTLTTPPREIAVHATDAGVVWGVLLSTTSGIHTDATWKCQAGFSDAWVQPGFDDSQWAYAKSVGGVYDAPWYPQIGTTINAEALWIWTNAYSTEVVCRKTLVSDNVKTTTTEASVTSEPTTLLESMTSAPIDLSTSCAVVDSNPIIIDSINPLQGIQAGGTQITLLGENFQPHVTIYMGDKAVMNEMACQNTICFVHSPAVNTSFINTPLSIVVQFVGMVKMDTDFKFTYKANPSIQNIHPLETLIDGGTTITVTGESLAAVGDPTLQVITVHTILNTAKSTTASFESPCTASSDKEMKCVTPKLTVPAQFISTQNDSQRKKRAEQERGDLIFEIENERLEVYLGLTLDGDDTYGKVSESLPELGRFAVFVLQPECEPFDGVLRLDPESSLSVRGKRLDHGLRASDYRIRVGDSEVCQVIDLTSNNIVCELPALSPNVQHGITVYPGVNLDAQFIGHIEISPHEDNTLYYIIGGSIAGGILIITPTIIIICVFVRRHKEQLQEKRAREAFDTDIVDSVRRDPVEASRHGIPLQVAV